MAPLGGLFGQLKPASQRRFGGRSRTKPGQATLRGASKRAYLFEVHRREAVPDLGDIGAVYAYARATAPDPAAPSSQSAGGHGYEPGYIGSTGTLARCDAEHNRLGHFIGFAFDVVLVMTVDQDVIRRDIETDLISAYRPVLNELLCGYQGTRSS
jgi:hypothetical protein